MPSILSQNSQQDITLSSRGILILFLAIIILAAGLRLYHLDEESLWTDEAFTLQRATQPSAAQIIDTIKISEAAPPGHYLLLHYWTKMAGTSEFAIRLPSVIFSLLSIILLYLIVSSLFGKKIAFLASLFMAISMTQVLYAQEARLYAMHLCLTLALTFFFMKYLQQKSNAYYPIAYSLLLFLALYTNYLSIIFPVVFTFILLWKKEKYFPSEKSFPSWLSWVSWNIFPFVLLLFIPFYGIAAAQYHALSNGLMQALLDRGVPAFFAQFGLFLYAFPALAAVALIVFFLLLHRKNLSCDIKWLTIPSDSLFAAVVIIAALVYLYLIFKPLTLFSIPIIKTPLTHSYFLIRHSFFFTPLIYVFLAWRIEKMKVPIVRNGLLLIVIVISIVALSAYYTSSTKPQWQEAAAYIESFAKDAPFILLDKGGVSNDFALAYYLPRSGRLSLSKIEEGRVFTRTECSALRQQLQRRSSLWLVLTDNHRTKDYYVHCLNQYYRPTHYLEVYRIKVYGYEDRVAKSLNR